jgi:hypothetical protein
VILKGYYGDKVSNKVTITSLEEQPLKITDITSTIDDKIKYKLKTVTKGKEYRLEVKTKSGIKKPFDGKVSLKTNNEKQPEIQISVTGRVENGVDVSPRRLNFGVIDTQEGALETTVLTNQLVVNKLSGDNLVIEKIDRSSDWISTETKTDQKGQQYTILITLDKNKLKKIPKGNFKEKITIHTKHSKIVEVMDVILQGQVI